MGSGRTLALLGAALAALVGGALYLVMSDDGGESVGGDTPPADGAPGEPGKGNAAPGAGPRRRPKVAGTAAISGVVRRREGSAAAAGQAVVVTRDGMEPWTATADEQGNFRVDELGEGGPYELVVEAKGFATIRLPGIALNRGEKRDVGTLWLDAAARATVTVRTQSAEPIAGAKVSAFAAPTYDDSFDWSKAVAQMAAEPIAVATRETDAKGAAVFPELASGNWTFVATKPGLSREGRANVRLEGGDSIDDIEILLRAAHSVKGRVFSDAGAPVPGALVIAMRMANFWDIGNGALRVRTSADAEGKFRVDTLAAGTWSLLAAAPGGAPTLAATIKVPAVREIDLHLATGGKLTGKVTHLDTGAPVEGAIVRAVSWAGTAQVAESTTDANGAYSFDPLPAPLVNDFTVEKPGLVLERTGVRWQVTMIPAGDHAVRDFGLRTGGTVDGVVTGADGKPVGGARVQLWIGRVNEGGEDGGATTTDAEGRFHFDGVAKGTAIAMVRGDGLYQRDFPADGWWSALQSPVRHSWMADAGPGIAAKLEVRMERGLRVSGTVEGPDGPVTGATVYAGAKQVRSGKDGAFVVEGIAPTPNLALAVSAPGFVAEQQTTVAVAEGAPLDDVRLVLLRQPVLRGKVYPAPGLTLADARAALSGAGEGDGESMEMVLPGASADDAAEWHAVRSDGSFSIPLPAATGRWTVRATADGHAVASSPPVEVSPAQQEYETSVTLVVGDVISGRVVSAGTGVAGARIGVTLAAEEAEMMFVDGMSAMPTIHATTDAAGLFTVANLAPGKYTVEASARGLVTESKAGVKPGSPAIEFVLAPELELGGQVVFDDGTPCAGVTVTARRENRRDQNPYGRPETGGVPAGSDGRFLIRGLAEGRYRLAIEPPWGGGVNVRRTTSDPIAAGTRDAKITAQRGLTISGRVLDAAKKPAEGCWVNAQPEGPGDHMWTGVQTKGDGTFEVVGLGEGSYTVHVQRHTVAGVTARPAQRQKIAAGTKDLEIVLEEGLAIEGTLVDAAGKPLGQVHLTAQPIQDEDDEDGERSFGQGAPVGPDGKFRIGGLAPGRYSIQMHIWDNSGAAASKVLTGGESLAAGTSGVRLVAIEGQRIGGICVDEAGAAVEGVQVMLHVPSSGFWRQATTGADGKFELAGVPEGKHTLSFSGAGRSARQMDGVAAGTRDLRVELERGLTITGRILRGDGTAAAGVQIHLTRTDEQAHGFAITGDEGDFTAEGLAAGSYKLIATVPKADAENAFEAKELGTAKAGDSGLRFTLR